MLCFVPDPFSSFTAPSELYLITLLPSPPTVLKGSASDATSAWGVGTGTGPVAIEEGSLGTVFCTESEKVSSAPVALDTEEVNRIPTAERKRPDAGTCIACSRGKTFTRSTVSGLWWLARACVDLISKVLFSRRRLEGG